MPRTASYCLVRRNDEFLRLHDSQWLGGYVEEIDGHVGRMDADAVERVEGATEPWITAWTEGIPIGGRQYGACRRFTSTAAVESGWEESER